MLEEHAEVFSSGGKVYVRKLGEAPIRVDGQEVERCELTDEKRLKVGGDVEFAVSFRKAAKTGSVKRGGAISFGSVPTYKEEELEGPSNEPLDLTQTTPEQRKAAEQSKAEALARRAEEQAQEERKNIVKNTLILSLGSLLVVGLIWLVIIPTIQKYSLPCGSILLSNSSSHFAFACRQTFIPLRAFF